MVYITGDCHGTFERFTVKSFPAQRAMTREDFVIVCGDFGGVWEDGPRERYWLDWLAQKSFTLLFVDGNHENFDRLYGDEFETVDFHGGKAHRIRENIYHLIRGYVFELGGKTFFAFGGARCHDIDHGILDPADFPSQREFEKVCKEWYRKGRLFRVNHESWWAQELPSQEEMDRGRRNLEALGYQVDFMITHCLPQVLVDDLFCEEENVLTKFFNSLILAGLNMGMWYCGHYHIDQEIMPGFQILYHKIVKIL